MRALRRFQAMRVARFPGSVSGLVDLAPGSAAAEAACRRDARWGEEGSQGREESTSDGACDSKAADALAWLVLVVLETCKHPPA